MWEVTWCPLWCLASPVSDAKCESQLEDNRCGGIPRAAHFGDLEKAVLSTGHLILRSQLCVTHLSWWTPFAFAVSCLKHKWQFDCEKSQLNSDRDGWGMVRNLLLVTQWWKGTSPCATSPSPSPPCSASPSSSSSPSPSPSCHPPHLPLNRARYALISLLKIFDHSEKLCFKIFIVLQFWQRNLDLVKSISPRQRVETDTALQVVKRENRNESNEWSG